MRLLWKFQWLGVQCLNSLVGRGRKAHGCLSGISSFPQGQLHSEGSHCQSRKLKCMCVFGEGGSTVRLKSGKKSPGASLTLYLQVLFSSSAPHPHPAPRTPSQQSTLLFFYRLFYPFKHRRCHLHLKVTSTCKGTGQLPFPVSGSRNSKL